MVRAKVITLDGHDGVGKTTLIRSTLSRLEQGSYNATSLRTALENPQQELTNPEMISAYLKAWQRTEQRITEISPHYDFVLVDRSYFSTYVLAKVLNIRVDDSIYQGFLRPDLAVKVNLREEERRKRMGFKQDKNSQDRKTLNLDLIRRADKVYTGLGLVEIDNGSSVDETVERFYRHIWGLK